MSVNAQPAPGPLQEPGPESDTEWSPKMAYPVVFSLVGLAGIGFGLVALISGASRIPALVLILAGAVLLLMGLDQFRRMPRLQLLPDGLIYFGFRGRTFVERELVHEVRLLRGRRRGVASLLRIEYFRDHAAAEHAEARREKGEMPDGELLMLSAIELGGDPREVASRLGTAGFTVVDATH